MGRHLGGLETLGQLTSEVALLARMQAEKKALPSGRWLWIGGTPGLTPRQFFWCLQLRIRILWLGSLRSDDGPGDDGLRNWGIIHYLIDRLPVVTNPIEVLGVSEIGVTPAGQRQEKTTYTIDDDTVCIRVGAPDEAGLTATN